MSDAVGTCPCRHGVDGRCTDPIDRSAERRRWSRRHELSGSISRRATDHPHPQRAGDLAGPGRARFLAAPRVAAIATPNPDRRSSRLCPSSSCAGGSRTPCTSRPRSERLWGRPITAAQLMAEVERMKAGSRQPEVLAEIFAELGNDPVLIAGVPGQADPGGPAHPQLVCLRPAIPRGPQGACPGRARQDHHQRRAAIVRRALRGGRAGPIPRAGSAGQARPDRSRRRRVGSPPPGAGGDRTCGARRPGGRHCHAARPAPGRRAERRARGCGRVLCHGRARRLPGLGPVGQGDLGQAAVPGVVGGDREGASTGIACRGSGAVGDLARRSGHSVHRRHLDADHPALGPERPDVAQRHLDGL